MRGIWPAEALLFNTNPLASCTYSNKHRQATAAARTAARSLTTPASPKIITAASQDLICPLRLLSLKIPAATSSPAGNQVWSCPRICNCQQDAARLLLGNLPTGSVGMILWSNLPLRILDPPPITTDQAFKLSQTNDAEGFSACSSPSPEPHSRVFRTKGRLTRNVRALARPC
ncbi:hypothetical protein N431DRAFT_57537 [Stipitochalara longipes BDJ]|nr:hypothetical protein N431DRAFT_57537 [Stipitochalara longipes BDJ]